MLEQIKLRVHQFFQPSLLFRTFQFVLFCYLATRPFEHLALVGSSDILLGIPALVEKGCVACFSSLLAYWIDDDGDQLTFGTGRLCSESNRELTERMKHRAMMWPHRKLGTPRETRAQRFWAACVE